MLTGDTQALAGYPCSRLFAKMGSKSHVTSEEIKLADYGHIQTIHR
jgi:hypothetical protein